MKASYQTKVMESTVKAFAVLLLLMGIMQCATGCNEDVKEIPMTPYVEHSEEKLHGHPVGEETIYHDHPLKSEAEHTDLGLCV